MESGTMLVLSRKLNESIIIGDQIGITVVGLRGNVVRLGIEAPDDVAIMREELLDAADMGEPAGSSAVPIAPKSDSSQAIAAR